MNLDKLGFPSIDNESFSTELNFSKLESNVNLYKPLNPCATIILLFSANSKNREGRSNPFIEFLVFQLPFTLCKTFKPP